MSSTNKFNLDKSLNGEIQVKELLAKAYETIAMAEKLADENQVSFTFGIGGMSSTYTPKKKVLELTKARAIEILQSSNEITQNMRQKIAQVLAGSSVSYKEQEVWDSSYSDYSYDEEGWSSSYG